MSAPARMLHPLVRRLDRSLGGPDRRRVIVAFAAVLALDSSDKATVGANATQLQAGLHIGRPQIGILLAVTSLVGAIATVPAGIWVDRVDRTRLLTAVVATWSVAMVLSGLATDFGFLLMARVLLGAVTAAAGPAIASLVGDYFPEHERGRIWGYILSGELIGAGFGFLVAGQFAVLSWRAPFFVLVAPTALVWWLVHRLAEPARGGAGRLRDPAGDEEDDRAGALAHRIARGRNIEPRAETVLDTDPERMPIRAAVRYVLRVRTNLVLIVASALGYFYFSGVRGFAVEFAKKHYGVGQSTATSLTLFLGVGALAGVLLGGRLADSLVRRGRLTARVELPGVTVLLAGVFFVPALLTRTLWLAVVLLVLAAACLGATNPPLDAARLDIIHPRLWGRAEAVRTVLRNAADAAAPVLFGVLSASVFTGGTALRNTFLVALFALFAAALVVLVVGRRTYPRDVATAARSAESTS